MHVFTRKMTVMGRVQGHLDSPLACHLLWDHHFVAVDHKLTVLRWERP